MRRLLPAALVGVLLTTAACSSLGGGATTKSDPAGTGDSPGAAPSAEPSEAAPQVKSPWKTGMREYGINVYWENSSADDDEVVRAKADRILDYIVGLNANAVAFSFPIYTTGIQSTTVKAGPKTPSAKRMQIVLEEATRRGLRSSVRPILNEDVLTAQSAKAWRGTIAPASRATWFKHYQALLLPYAAASEAGGATTFVAGTEYNSLEKDKRWSSLIKAIRQKFTGEVGYSANFDNYQSGAIGIPADVVGVDAYLRLGDLPDSTPASKIASGWSKWLRKHDPDGPPVLHEVGLAAQNGAYLHPGSWGDGERPLNLTVQKHWYEGVCQALQDGDAAGVYWWKIDFDANPATANKKSEDRMTFVGRPAAGAIKECFAKPA
jgi:hypothetical protein